MLIKNVYDSKILDVYIETDFTDKIHKVRFNTHDGDISFIYTAKFSPISELKFAMDSVYCNVYSGDLPKNGIKNYVSDFVDYSEQWLIDNIKLIQEIINTETNFKLRSLLVSFQSTQDKKEFYKKYFEIKLAIIKD